MLTLLNAFTLRVTVVSAVLHQKCVCCVVHCTTCIVSEETQRKSRLNCHAAQIQAFCATSAKCCTCTLGMWHKSTRFACCSCSCLMYSIAALQQTVYRCSVWHSCVESMLLLQEWQKLDAEYVAQQFPSSTTRRVLHKLAAML